VPTLTGKTVAQATSILEGDGFTLKENPPGQSSTVPANEIMSQNPVAGSKVKAGTAITVKLSEGPQMVTMPAYLFGETCSIATTRLQRLGVTASCPSAKAIASERIASGEVARVLYGTTNNPVAVPKGATVILELSTGPGPSSGTTTTTTPTGATTTSTTTTTLAGQGVRAVPNVVGMNQAEVIAAMKKAVLYFTTTGPGAGTPQWTTVISESPGAGTLVPYKSTVVLHVGE
jgi:serine/threonine-protein kinase